ncbi:long chain fatty acid oxidase [Histoplasma capsulatum var. duboisii H88]|uniref:Long chain fatty acid oxidase n=1 Tax=Ajellomyces capsulatus (strain H88) TaxID=544711 RepID=A0A8A1LN43_AJEC8|nr:long chain fatty acid oxidase [Histoplasma capsulatum var. duboisii H88]
MVSPLTSTTVEILESPLPPAPAASTVLTPLQWKTLLALADTVIPSIRPRSAAVCPGACTISDAEFALATHTLQSVQNDFAHSDIAVQFLAENASSVPEFKESMCRVLGQQLPDEARRGISVILNALNSRPVALALTGYAAPIQCQPYPVREAIFRGWATSVLPPIRSLYRSLIALFHKAWVPLSPTLPAIIGFPRVPVNFTPVEGYPYEFMQFPPGDNTEAIMTDVVIIGSGCGAAVAAKNIAEAGHNVIVVEKSYYWSEKHFPMTMKEGALNLFENGGTSISDDGSVAVISGSVWGGGGTINWSASLQTQSYVRQEWANKGLPFFTSAEFQRSLDRVCDRMGVNTEHVKHNHANHLLLEGARKLGYAAKTVPQNTGNQEHNCGHCTLGCGSCGKKGPQVTFLADAARAGAQFIEGFHAERILFKEGNAGNCLAHAIEGTWTSRDLNRGISGKPVITRKVVIKAKKVIVACGSLQSPLLLLRSGLKNPQIGRNLYLHPVVLLSAVFGEEMKPWEGAILTAVINEFEDLDGRGHGAKIETVTTVPSFFLPVFPWTNGLEYKRFVSKLRNMAGFITVTRERYGGRVYPDPVDGRCRISYTPSLFDRKNMIEAIIGAAKVAYVCGAQEIYTSSRDIPSFIRPERSATDTCGPEAGINHAAFQAWIKKVRHTYSPLSPEHTVFASAHQMGTCRMGTSPKSSVVSPSGKVWGTEGLYVADASVFPSASGVNPMVTNMAISDWTTQNILKVLHSERTPANPRL